MGGFSSVEREDLHVGERDEGFADFFKMAEPRLRRALVAAYGGDVGREATADALAYAWQNWERVRVMENPIGYLYRVGQSRSRRRAVPQWTAPACPTGDQWYEPRLLDALSALTDRERAAVVLIEGYGYSFRDAAATIGVSPSSLQSYLHRGMTKLRSTLGVSGNV